MFCRGHSVSGPFRHGHCVLAPAEGKVSLSLASDRALGLEVGAPVEGFTLISCLLVHQIFVLLAGPKSSRARSAALLCAVVRFSYNSRTQFRFLVGDSYFKCLAQPVYKECTEIIASLTNFC